MIVAFDFFGEYFFTASAFDLEALGFGNLITGEKSANQLDVSGTIVNL